MNIIAKLLIIVITYLSYLKKILDTYFLPYEKKIIKYDDKKKIIINIKLFYYFCLLLYNLRLINLLQYVMKSINEKNKYMISYQINNNIQNNIYNDSILEIIKLLKKRNININNNMIRSIRTIIIRYQNKDIVIGSSSFKSSILLYEKNILLKDILLFNNYKIDNIDNIDIISRSRQIVYNYNDLCSKTVDNLIIDLK